MPLADAYRRSGDLLRARLVLAEGLRRHPDFASAHVVALRIARDVSDHEGAMKAARRVLALDPGNTEARRALDHIGSRREASRSSAPSIPGDDGEPALPEESWMVGDAGVWGPGTDSGLASVDPIALNEEDEQARSLAQPSGVAAAEEGAVAGEVPVVEEGEAPPEATRPVDPEPETLSAAPAEEAEVAEDIAAAEVVAAGDAGTPEEVVAVEEAAAAEEAAAPDQVVAVEAPTEVVEETAVAEVAEEAEVVEAAVAKPETKPSLEPEAETSSAVPAEPAEVAEDIAAAEVAAGDAGTPEEVVAVEEAAAAEEAAAPDQVVAVEAPTEVAQGPAVAEVAEEAAVVEAVVAQPEAKPSLEPEAETSFEVPAEPTDESGEPAVAEVAAEDAVTPEGVEAEEVVAVEEAAAAEKDAAPDQVVAVEAPAEPIESVAGLSPSEPRAERSESRGKASDRTAGRPLESARRKSPPVAQPSTPSSSSDEANIYTRTMGQLYEQQGLYAHAIVVYEHLLESDPGDDGLSRHLERLRQRAGEEASTRASAARMRRFKRDSAKVASADSRSPHDDERPPEPASERGTEFVEAESSQDEETARKPATPIHGSDLLVVPIESLAPDPPATGAQGEAP